MEKKNIIHFPPKRFMKMTTNGNTNTSSSSSTNEPKEEEKLKSESESKRSSEREIPEKYIDQAREQIFKKYFPEREKYPNGTYTLLGVEGLIIETAIIIIC